MLGSGDLNRFTFCQGGSHGVGSYVTFMHVGTGDHFYGERPGEDCFITDDLENTSFFVGQNGKEFRSSYEGIQLVDERFGRQNEFSLRFQFLYQFFALKYPGAEDAVRSYTVVPAAFVGSVDIFSVADVI